MPPAARAVKRLGQGSFSPIYRRPVNSETLSKHLLHRDIYTTSKRSAHSYDESAAW
jgi:hypothetical protein